MAVGVARWRRLVLVSALLAVIPAVVVADHLVPREPPLRKDAVEPMLFMALAYPPSALVHLCGASWGYSRVVWPADFGPPLPRFSVMALQHFAIAVPFWLCVAWLIEVAVSLAVKGASETQ